MKIISLLLIMLTVFTVIPACSKGNNTSDASTDKTTVVEKTDPVKQTVADNALRPVVMLANPSTMTVETKPRNAATVNSEKALAETCAEKFLEFAALNGIDNTLAEFTKSKNGIFKGFLPATYFYGAIIGKEGEKWKIVAHATSPDYVGVEVDTSAWLDLTGWAYLKDVDAAYAAGKSNRFWLDSVYWKDPNWSNEKSARFTAYNRFYNLAGNDYWMHYTIWLDE